MPNPIIRAANAREKARQEKNQWKARARKAERLLAAVRELHSRTFTEFDEWLDETVQRCLGCHMLHPCPTIQALEGDPDGSQ